MRTLSAIVRKLARLHNRVGHHGVHRRSGQSFGRRRRRVPRIWRWRSSVRVARRASARGRSRWPRKSPPRRGDVDAADARISRGVRTRSARRLSACRLRRTFCSTMVALATTAAACATRPATMRCFCALRCGTDGCRTRALRSTLHRADLAARFDAARARGDIRCTSAKRRASGSRSRDVAGALVLARDNWKVQREPADLRILAGAALARGRRRGAEDRRRLDRRHASYGRDAGRGARAGRMIRALAVLLVALLSSAGARAQAERRAT